MFFQFAFCILLALAPFVWVTTSPVSTQKRNDATAILSALLLCSIILFPYWIFGKYSAIGWNDEFDLTIPWNIKLTQLKEGETFYHEFAGGTGIRQATAWIEHVSLLRLLFASFPDWIAAAIYRILELFSLFAGLYFSSRKIFNTHARAAFIGASVGSFICIINYGWVIGGINWLYAAIAWGPYVFFSNWARPSTGRLHAIAYGSIVACTTFPAFFLAGYFLFYFPLLIFLYWFNRQAINLKEQATKLVLMILPIAINWSDLPQFLATMSADSARLNGLTSLENVKLFLSGARPINTGRILFSSATDMLAWAISYHNAILLCCILLSYLKLRESKYVGIFYAFAASTLVMLLLPLIGHLFNAEAIKNYRWNQNFDNALVWAALLSSLAANTFFKNNAEDRMVCSPSKANSLESKCQLHSSKLLTSALYMVFAWSIALLSYPHIYKTLHGLSTYGGWGVFSEYNQLAQLKSDQHDFRVISAGYTPKAAIAPAYSLDTFDGMRANFSWRRSMFFKHVILKNYTPEMHASRHHIFNGVPLSDVNFNALNMVNIKYLLSDSPINIPYENKRTFLELGASATSLGYGNSAMGSNWNSQMLIPPLVAYEIGSPWERVFIAQRIDVSEYANFEVGFYQQLATLAKHNVLIAKNDSIGKAWPRDANAQILSTRKDVDGMTIYLNKKPTTLIYNQEYDPNWQVTCNDNIPVQHLPVNGVMMAAYVPSGCEKIKFRYPN